MVFILAIFAIHHRKSSRVLGAVGGALLVGGLIIALPQCMINYKYVRSYSPKVYTEQLYGYSHDLQTQQILWGLSYPRYETYIGNSTDYPSNGVFFNDTIGNEIIEREGITQEEFSLGSIIKLFIHYPLDMTALYMKHFISALTPAYRQVYITDINTDKGIIVSVSILIWIMAGIGVFENMSRDFLYRGLWIFGICMAGLLQLFGAPELRFFLPLYICCYFYVFVVINYKEMFAKTKGKSLLKCFILGCIVYLLWLTVFANVLSENSKKNLLINGKQTSAIHVENAVTGSESNR